MTGNLFSARGGNAVMASRSVEFAQENDYFPTPPWASRAGAELVLQLDPRAKTVWEPACGEGHMAYALAETFMVSASDLVDYGGAFATHPPTDFLGPAGDRLAGEISPDWIMSNPPFKDGEAFVRLALRRARRGVAMLLRLQWKEGAGRHQLVTRDCPMAMSAVFSERVPMFAARWDPNGSTATAYCWFLFLTPQAEAESPLAAAIMAARGADCSLERLIPPGTRTRLERPQDLLTWGPASIRACTEQAEAAQARGDAKSLKVAKELREAAARIAAQLQQRQQAALFEGAGQ
jgi:hypothetical protein